MAPVRAPVESALTPPEEWHEQKDQSPEARNSVKSSKLREQASQETSSHGPPVSVVSDGLTEIWEWNKTVPGTIHECIHDRISTFARSNPNRPAVTSWDGDLSYGRLNTLSDLLATRLIGHGAGTGTIIPICFDKSIWASVALLAVLKSGSTVTMTDPTQPEARLQTIAEEVNAKLVLCSVDRQELAEKIAPAATVLPIGPEMFNVPEAERASLPTVDPDSLMYIIFTSGSTGKPKGVTISHSNFTSGAVPRAEAVGYQLHSRVLDFPSYAFDVSYDCMLCTLASGGCICVPSDQQRVNDLSGAIRGMNVNMAHMTPSVARLLDDDIVPSLEVLGVGGEALSMDNVLTWSATTKVVNAYGPSECTVGCTINNHVAQKSYITIGKGCGGCTWICDPENHDRLLELGAVGELLIEGPIVGPGYLGNPEKTKEVFIESPRWLQIGSATTPGRAGRLYKTGDLVKYDGDGSIIFVGRKDQQVKIRGQRVELEEIEHNIRKKISRGISLAAEVINPAAGEGTLVVFLSHQTTTSADDQVLTVPLSDDLETTLRSLQAYLATELPKYMVPTVFIPLEAMPLLVSLKIDRKKLRQFGATLSRRDIAGLRLRETKNTARNEDMEIRLGRIWASLLGCGAHVEADDDFFALGGDSLRAMKLVSLARKDGLSVSVFEVLQNPVLSDMALVVKEIEQFTDTHVPPFSLIPTGWTMSEACTTVAKLCETAPTSIEDVYPCTPLQEGLMALSAKVNEAYIAQRVVQLPDVDTATSIKKAFQQVEQECEILRTRIVQVSDHGLLQVVVKQGNEWHMGNDLAGYLKQDREQRMDLGGPLIRYALISDDKQSQVCLVLTMHHALYDGWSMPLLVNRINRAYHRYEPLRTTPFRNFISHLSSIDRSVSESYWHNTLKGANKFQFPLSPYPGHQPRSDSLLERYIKVDSRSVTNKTLATIIRGAWALVAASYCGSNDVIIGETLTGRNAPVEDIEDIVAPMITTVPLRVNADRGLTTKQYLDAVHTATIERVPHEHLGLQNIRRLDLDIRQACELKTGLVLHPRGEEASCESGPASDLMPAGDTEAAREALKFNSYNLMLVCTQDAAGFLVMASFDSDCVSVDVMKCALQAFEQAFHFLSENSATLGEFEITTPEVRDELRRLSNTGAAKLAASGKLSFTSEDVRGTWIVHTDDNSHVVPIGAVGELLLESTNPTLSAEKAKLHTNHWLFNIEHNNGGSTHLYCSGQLARYESDGTISLLGSKDQVPATQKADRTSAVSSAKTELSEQETILRRHWSKLLSMDEQEILRGDNLFELGGDSITAMKLVSELRLEGYALTVSDIFNFGQLSKIAAALQRFVRSDVPRSVYVPFSTLDSTDIEQHVRENLYPALTNPKWKIIDAYEARPLQAIAVEGTVNLPRFSTRYELFHLSGHIDKITLFSACQKLVDQIEILRTVFVKAADQCIGVVLEKIHVEINDVQIDGPVKSFATQLCGLDSQTRMPLGSSFVKFMFIEGTNEESVLIMRISHAQYDEVCLPHMLRQLSALYQSNDHSEQHPPLIPYSRFVHHVVKECIPQSIAYWKDLLRGSTMTILRPDTPVTATHHFATVKEFDISSRPKQITVATLPTAAWALCLARKFSVSDVTFGEVVSGRSNIAGLPEANTIMGPTWQYIPVRVKFDPEWTALDLLNAVQTQHAASGPHATLGIEEIISACGSDMNWPEDTTWFDTVVHQDVAHVESLSFLKANSSMETIYPHQEPLREWKIQAFHDGDRLAIEVVTVESWKDHAESLVNEIGQCLLELVECSNSPLLRG